MTISAIFDVGPRPARRAIKGLVFAALNVAGLMLFDWLFPAPSYTWHVYYWFGGGLFSGYFFWGRL